MDTRRYSVKHLYKEGHFFEMDEDHKINSLSLNQICKYVGNFVADNL